MDEQNFKLLLHGIDTLQCAYYLHAPYERKIDFQCLAEKREEIRHSKNKNPLPITLGTTEFLLHPFGSSSGYPFVISNADFKIELGEYNNPNFFVTYKSQALWQDCAYSLHDKFLKWAQSVGYFPFREESLSRVDYCFDYHLPEIDFNEDDFVSRASKDSQYRENGKVQTFSLGKGDIVLRVYDKVAEISQQSDKVWFYILWGQDKGVWRIEWQVRKPVLKGFDIKTFENLKSQQGDLLWYLATSHDTLRQPADDTNSSRWPLHPLWKDLQAQIEKLNHLGISRVYGQNSVLEERMTRMAIAVYGYSKRVAAVHCVQNRKTVIGIDETFQILKTQIQKLYEPLAWQADIEQRKKEIELGQW